MPNTSEQPPVHLEKRAEANNETVRRLEALAQEIAAKHQDDEVPMDFSPSDIHEEFAPAMIEEDELALMSREELEDRAAQLKDTALETLRAVRPEDLRAMKEMEATA